MQMTIGSEEEACGLQRRDELARLRDCRPGIGDSDGFRIPSGTRSGQVHGILAHAQIPDGKCVIGRIVSDDIRQQSARASGQNGVTGRDREFRAEINSEFVSGESNVARFHTRMTRENSVSGPERGLGVLGSRRREIERGGKDGRGYKRKMSRRRITTVGAKDPCSGQASPTVWIRGRLADQWGGSF